jgi:hypothetical protein
LIEAIEECYVRWKDIGRGMNSSFGVGDKWAFEMNADGLRFA